MAAVRMPALAVVALTVACGSDCDDSGVVPSYSVGVTDAQDGTSICDAEVFMGTEKARSNSQVCRYGLDIPTVLPSVTIRAEHPDYKTVSKTVSTKFSADECGHAIQRKVELMMEKK